MKKALLIQPGAFGDIIVCAPIAKWYSDRGYEVTFPARKKYHSLLNSIPYVTPLELDDLDFHPDWLACDVMKCLPLAVNYDLVLNLADRGPHPLAQHTREKNQETKYRLAKVPRTEQHKLVWERNIEKENEIYDKYAPDGEYAFVHNTSSDGESINLPNISLPIVYNDTPEGYNIFDWYKVIKNAAEIYCTESAIHCFCDGIIDDITEKRYLLPRKQGLGELVTTSYFWDLKYFYED